MIESLNDIREIGEMQRVEFRSGDKFVLMMPDRISPSLAAHLHATWERFSGGFPLLILDGGAKLGVIGPE